MMSKDENDTEGVFSKGFSINDKEMQNKYYKSIAMVIIGVIIALTAFITVITLIVFIPIGITICLYGLYGIYSYKFKPEKYKEALEKSKNGENRRIIYYKRGLIVLILGLMILIIEILVDVLMYSGHFFFPRPGAPIVSLEGGVFIWVIVIAVIVMLGGLFMVLKNLWYLKISTPSKKKKMEDSKKIIDYLKIDNSGITKLRLASVLQMDLKIINKCLHYLEWLGLIEKKKVSAEETLFFYKKENEKDINDEEIRVS